MFYRTIIESQSRSVILKNADKILLVFMAVCYTVSFFVNCRWVTLWAGKPQQCPPKARKFSPPLKKTNYPTK